MTQKNMKFRVKDGAHSEAIQEKLFEMGFGWVGEDFDVQHTDKSFLYTEEKYLLHGETEGFFDEDSSIEHILTKDGKIAPLVDENLPVAEAPQETKQEPSVVLRPQKEMWLDRAAELLAAMSLCVDKGQKIPYDWIDELSQANDYL